MNCGYRSKYCDLLMIATANHRPDFSILTLMLRQPLRERGSQLTPILGKGTVSIVTVVLRSHIYFQIAVDLFPPRSL